jgi:hypothetical protein
VWPRASDTCYCFNTEAAQRDDVDSMSDLSGDGVKWRFHVLVHRMSARFVVICSQANEHLVDHMQRVAVASQSPPSRKFEPERAVEVCMIQAAMKFWLAK